MVMISGRKLFGSHPDGPYSLLGKLDCGLLVDIGAAAGIETERMLRNSPQSHVIAIEPFPGNHKYFTEKFGSDPRVTLINAAVSDQDSTAHFFVPSTVKGTEGGLWNSMPGYSSLGMLVKQPGAPSQTFEVQTLRLDSITTSPIRFLKIDTQGAEHAVLQGAGDLLRNQQIDILHVEFEGEADVAALLVDCGYEFLDAKCVLLPSSGAWLHDWDVVRVDILSNGRFALSAWPKQTFEDARAYGEFIASESKRLGKAWTDLIAVNPDTLRKLTQ